MKFDPDKLTLDQLMDLVFLKASAEGVQLRVRLIYPKPAKKKAAKKVRRAA